LYKRKKSRANHDKSIRKFIYLDKVSHKGIDALDNFFKIASNLLYNEKESLETKLKQDKI